MKNTITQKLVDASKIARNEYTPVEGLQKIEGEIKSGKSFYVYWKDDTKHSGHLFSLPDQNVDEGDIMYQIQMGEYSEWGHLYELVSNEHVDKIIIV